MTGDPDIGTLDQPDTGFLVPASERDVNQLAIIHALRANADGLKTLGNQMDRQSRKIDGIVDTTHSVDKRLAVIEGNSLQTKVKEIEGDVEELKADKQRREGAIRFGEWFFKNWPAVFAFVGIVVYVVLAQTGKL